MFLEYYGLREQPFGVTPNPRYLYHSPVHREALASLIYGIEADLGFAALIAEPGMGKTTLLFYVLEKFRATARTALVFQTQCSGIELLRYLANEFEIDSDATDPVELNERIKEVLVREARAQRKVIVIIDEAQNLAEEALEAVRLLSDFETPDFKLLHIILAGQPQLAEKLARPSLAQLLQRIAMLNRLTALSSEDTGNYIEYRLGVAGYRGEQLFTPEAVEEIAALSGGIPRKINRICFNALSLACALDKKQIDAEIVQEVGADLDVTELLYDSGALALSDDEPRRTKRPTAPRLSVQNVTPPQRVADLETAATVDAHHEAAVAVESAPPQSPDLASAPMQARVSHVEQPQVERQVTPPQVQALRTPVTAPTPPQAPRVPVAPASTARTYAPRTPVQQAPRTREIQSPARNAPAPKPSSGTRGVVLTGVIGGAILLAGWGVWQKLPAHGAQPDPAAAVTPSPEDGSVSLPTTDPASNSNIGQAVQKGRSQARKHTASSADKGQPVAGSRNSHGQSNTPTVEIAGNSADANVDFGSSSSPANHDALGVAPASLIRRVQPAYPQSARRDGIEGTVIVAAVIGRDGRTKNVHAVSGNPVLSQAAVEAVRKWVYRPYQLNGKPTDVDTEVVINFDLKNQKD